MVLQETMVGHLVRLISPESSCVFEHFQEDHWIIEVEMMDKSQIPNNMIIRNKIII